MDDDENFSYQKGCHETTLALFFTFSYTLQDWYDSGILTRELALYKQLLEDYDKIYIFTYDSYIRNELREKVPEQIEIVPKKYISNNYLYSIFLPFIHWKLLLKEVNIYKTNQMMGAWPAIMARILFRKKLIIRTGYILTIFNKRNYSLVLENGKSRRSAIRYYVSQSIKTALELVAYQVSDVIITSSKHGYEYIEEKYSPNNKHVIIENYVLSDVFRPIEEDINSDVCFVGRLNKQKNLENLLLALSNTNISLTIIGDGEKREYLKELALELGAEVEFAGRVNNENLPNYINSHHLFILPSLFEGMPKSLLEAMSCGKAVVGTDVIGINDVLEHRKTGFLTKTDPMSIQNALEELLQNATYRDRLGDNARQTILERYSLEVISEKERQIHQELVS